MALIAVLAVVDVSANSLVLAVCGAFVMRVAIGAREHRVVGRIGVTVIALIDPVMR